MESLLDVWPLFGVRIRTPRLELRLPAEADYASILAVVDAGIHDPSTMPFGVAWTDYPAPERDRRAIQYWWSTRAGLSSEHWNLDFTVFLDGRPIGFQGLRAENFAGRREVETGSWLGLAFQGKGFGKEMRAAIVAFAFETLGAVWVTSAAFTDNAASNRVSIATGYEPDGINIVMRRGERAVSQRYRLRRDRWEVARPPVPVTVEGWTPACAAMLGVAEN